MTHRHRSRTRLQAAFLDMLEVNTALRGALNKTAEILSTCTCCNAHSPKARIAFDACNLALDLHDAKVAELQRWAEELKRGQVIQ